MVDATRVSAETAREIVRLSELYLDGTVKLLVASDSKATSLAGMLVTSSTALIAAAVTLLLASPLPERNIVLGAAAIGTAGCLLAGLWSTLLAARPRPFNVPGNYLREWTDPDDIYGSLTIALVGQAEIYQAQIDENAGKIDEATNFIYRALKFVVIAPLAGVIVGVMAYFLLRLVAA